MPKSKFKKLMIVIEETGERKANGDQPFIVYLQGHDPALNKVPKDDLPTAEFWARELFRICGAALAQSGAIDPNFKASAGH